MILAILGTIILCGFIGMYSGSRGTPLWPRRYLIPTIITVHAVVAFGPWAILCMTMCGVFSIGYGRPDEEDDGSLIGRFWYDLFGKKGINLNPKSLDSLIRATVSFIWSCSLISIPILHGNWLEWLLAMITAMFTYVIFGAIIENEWVIETDDRTYLTEDFFIYSLLTSISMYLIYV